MNRYYIAVGSERSGPFTPEELGTAAVPLTGNTLVWAQGMVDWARADSIPELEPLLAEHVSITPQTPSVTGISYSSPMSPTPPPGDVVTQRFDGFIVLNPALPRMAQAICLYALIINPALTILSSFSCLTFRKWEDAATPGAAASNLLFIVTDVLCLALTGLVAYGGFQLRSMARRGVRWLKIAFAINVALFPVVFLAAVAIGFWQVSITDSSAASPPTTPTQTAGDVIEWLLGAAQLLTLPWEIACLVWLIKRGSRLSLA